MAFQSVVTMEKPLQHISLADWNARVIGLRNVADARRADAFALRHSSRTLRNETRIESDWASIETNDALADRIIELNNWRQIIERTFKRIEDEIHALQEEKDITERELAALSAPIAVISEVLTMRDSRFGSEMTYDEPDTEVKNELRILENNQRLLAERCQKAWAKLTRLEEVRFKIGMEIENKVEAVDLDNVQLALDRNSAGISYKPDPMRNPKNSCSYESWLEHVKNIKQLAENELADTSAIREEVRFKINRELKDKQDTEDTESALLAMNRNSTNISYKPDPLRNPRECCSYEHWLEHAKNIKQLAENELAETSAIRNAMIVCRQKSRDLLEAQRARTEYAFRKRIFLTQQAKNELEWQQLKLREEIKNLTCEIQSLEDALQSKTGMFKLAETRLETRAMRCVTELCLDEPHHLLCNEVEKLREIQRCLMNKIDDAKANLNLLSDHAKKVDDDLENKKQSLQTDSEALQLHETLNEEEFAVLKDHNPCEQTDRNVELTRVVLDPRK